MVDFRSPAEKRAARQHEQNIEADYKKMYQEVLAENQAYRDRLISIETDHAELHAKFAELLTAFEEHKATVAKHTSDMLQSGAAIQDMVASSYEKNQALMEYYRTDIDRRLASAADISKLETKGHA